MEALLISLFFVGRGGGMRPPRAGVMLPGAGVTVMRAGRPALARGPGHARWPASMRTARGSRPAVAHMWTGGEEERARTGDNYPGCNYLVRGYRPSMHFFLRGDMPHFPPPLPFRQGRAGCPSIPAGARPARARGGGRGSARWQAGTRPRLGRALRAAAA